MTKDHEMVKKVIEMAAVNLKQEELLLPTFFVGKEDGIAIVGAPWGNDSREKDHAAEEVKRIAKEMKAEFILFVSESWTIRDQEAAREFQNDRRKYPSVKDHPKAVEVVMFTLETQTGARVGLAEILPGRVMGEVIWQPKEMHMEGRFSNLLGPKPKIH